MLCPVEMRIMGADLPEEYSMDDESGVPACSFTSCPAAYRVFMPRNACEQCLFTEEAYAYNPPVQSQCESLCKPSGKAPVKNAASYSKIGEDGLVGKEDIKSLSKMMLPVYVLPLFNMVATFIFIKGLSGILGGDIEIPGLSKVF